MGRAKDPEKHRYWTAQLRAWQGSGLTQTEFCRQQGIRRRLLSAWKRRLGAPGQEPPAVRFVPVTIRPEPVAKGVRTAAVPSSLAVVTGSGYRVEVGDDFAPQTLARLLVTLERL